MVSVCAMLVAFYKKIERGNMSGGCAESGVGEGGASAGSVLTHPSPPTPRDQSQE